MSNGQTASRGFVYQVFICLLDSLHDDSWTDVTVEPDTTHDKVDILFESANEKKAVQVKSSITNFTKSEINTWLSALAFDNLDTDTLKLVLIGNCSDATKTYINTINNNTAKNLPKELQQHAGRLNLELKLFDIKIMPGATRDSLNRFLFILHKIIIPFPGLDLLANACVGDISIISTKDAVDITTLFLPLPMNI